MSRKKLCPVNDPNCQKYIDDPNRQWYMGRWKTLDQIKSWREYNLKYHRKRCANDPGWLEKKRERDRERGSDPEYRRRKAIYMLHFRHAKKKERYGDQGLTLGNDGQEDRQGRDRTAA